jgi:hypothetical protein
MTELTQDLSLAQAHSLIDSYAFDLGGSDTKELLSSWLDIYHASWIRLATVEALYRGRYKSISIEHILSVWSRLGSPNTNFTYEFERLICRKLPKHLSDLSETEGDRKSDFSQTQELTIIEDTQQDASESDLNLEKAFQSPKSSSSNNIPIISTWGFSCQTDWSEFTQGHKIIHQFIPLPDVSSFFNKLKTFSEEKLERQ